MKPRFLSLLAGLLIAAAARGQAVPKVTKEGRGAYERLLAACARDGALKVAKKPDGTEVVVVDEARLKRTVAARPKLLTPALRDAVVANWFRSDGNQKPVHGAVLRAYAAQTKDERASAFAALFTATAERERKLSAAIPPYEKAVRHFTAVGDAAWQAVCLNDIGLTRYYLADYPRARDALRRALGCWRKVHDGPHGGPANTLDNLGLVADAFGDYAEALAYYRQALAMRRKLHAGPDADTANTLNSIGAACQALGDYGRVLEYHRQALAMLAKLSDEPRPDVAMILDNIGAAYNALGDTVRGMDYLRRGLALRERLHRGPHRATAQSLHNLGTACQQQGDHAGALAYLRRALAMKRKLYPRPHPDLALTLNSLGLVSSDLGDSAHALEYHEQALAVWRGLHDAPHPAVAASLNNLATVYRDRGESGKAQQTLDKALKELCLSAKDEPFVFARLPARQLRPLPQTVLVLRNRGRTLEDALPANPSAQQLRECQHCYALAAELLDRVRQESLVHETSKLHAGAKEVALTVRQVRLCRRLYEKEGNVGDLGAAFHAVEQGRARVFLQALGRTRAGLLGGVSAELRARESRLVNGLRSLDLRIERAEAAPGQSDTPLVKLWEERNQVEAELQHLAAEMEKRFPQYAALQYPKPCTLLQARDCLADNEVAVLFALDKKESYAVVAHKKPAPGDKGQGVAVVKLSGSDVLGPRVRTLADEEVLKSDSRCRRLGAELYALLLKPLEEHLKGKNLVIAPDGILWQLPFELLVEGRAKDDDGKYLGQTRQLRYTPSMTVLHLIGLWEQKRKAPSEPLWALGDPVFGKDDRRGKGNVHEETAGLLARYAQRRRGGTTWQRLPGTGAEVRDAAKMFGAVRDDAVTGPLASEKIVKAASTKEVLGRKRYVLFATHGILGSALGRPPSLVLSLVGNDGKEELGGANDGFLTMQEVTHLKFNADLVVLSACKSARGEVVPGEGVMGLTRAFLYAGSRGVVCSLWSVDDERTAELMKAMYAELKQGKGSAEALALARRKLIAEEQAPFYWAPFILIGK